MCRWESLRQLCLSLHLDLYRRDGLFPAGEWAGLSQMIPMASFKILGLAPCLSLEVDAWTLFFFLILWELTRYPIMVQSLLFFLMITSMSALIWTCNLGFLTYLFVLPRLLRQSRTTSISLRILRLSFRFVIHDTFPEEHIVGFPLRISLI